MSTYNGEKYLEEQLNSILNQKNVSINILVRDDGSQDKTIDILNLFKKEGKLDWYSGNNLKPARSFLDLVKTSKKYDYYAFSDQDDYWEENKIERAINQLEQSNSKNGKLYLSCLKVVDSNLNLMYKSFIPKNITLKNEMIKNYATGCTMVFDDNLKKIINCSRGKYVAMHDSFIYRLALIHHSYVYVDQESYICYRQHGSNVLGMTNGFINTWKRRWKHFIHSECIASKTAIELINNENIHLSSEDYEFLNLLANYKKNLSYKRKLLNMKIFDRNEKMTNILFKIKLIFNRV